VLYGRQRSTQSSSDGAQLKCLKQTLWFSVVQMIFGGGVCHVLMLPFQWVQKGDSCSRGDHIGVHRKRSLDCCVSARAN